MNHSTKITSLLAVLASSALALAGCMADATGPEDEDQATASAETTDAEGANAATEENTSESSEALNWHRGFGYFPPGYAYPGYGFNPWYPGFGYFRPGFGYYHPGFGYLPPYYRGLPPGYGYFRPGYGYWRPHFGYWRGTGWGW